MSHIMRKLDFAYMKTKMQISCAVTPQLISAFVFPTQIVQFLFYIQNFKLLAFFCDFTDCFLSDLAGDPADRFSRVAAHDCKDGTITCTKVQQNLNVSRRMGKATICRCENKDADQRLCFRYSDSTIPLISKSKISSF